ncbi:MAG: tetratricopeptide repeat protein [Bacteroidota bacterium]
MTGTPSTLVLQIGRKRGNSYAVQVLHSPAGETTGRFVTPYEGDALEQMLATIGQGVARETELRRIGRALYSALFTREVSARLQVCLSLAKQRKPVRVQLRLDAEELARLPWELLHDGSRYLVSSGLISLTRYVSLPQPVTPTTVNLPLRVLAVVARPLDAPPLDPFAEAQALEQGLLRLRISDRAVVDYLRPSTHESLVAWLGEETYPVVHFDGHGIFGRLCDRCGQVETEEGHFCAYCRASLVRVERKGYLAFENEFGQSHLIDADDMANTLTKAGVKLSVLSACESAVSAKSDLFVGVAPALIRAGVPAVVAMQFSVPASSAIRFSKQFYTALARFATVEDAVTEGRKVLYPEKHSWFIPVLYLRAEESKLLKRGQSKATVQPRERAAPNNLYSGGLLRLGQRFVGRLSERIDIAREIAEPANCVVALWGMKGIGKSALALQTARHQDWRFPGGVVWMSLRGGKPLDTLLEETAATLEIVLPEKSKEKRQTILRRLNRLPHLLVLDSYEDVESDNEISDFLDSLPAQSKALLTTYPHPSRKGWRAIELQELNPDDAWTLFVILARDAGTLDRITQREKVAREIVQWLQGYPLGIELVVPLTLDTSLPSIFRRLQAGPVDRVAATLDVAYKALGKKAQVLLNRLAVFDHEFDEGPGMAVGGVAQWEDCKSELVRRALLRFDGQHYDLHSVVRQYAYGRLADRKTRHLLAAQYYHSEHGHDPLRAARHYYEAKVWGQFLSLAVKVAEPEVFSKTGRWGEVANMLQKGLDLTQRLDDRKAAGGMFRGLGTIHYHQGKLRDALSDYGNALAIFREQSDRTSEGYTLSNLGYVLRAQGKHEEAIKAIAEARSIFQDTVDRSGESRTLNNLGVTYWEQGKWQEAVDCYQQDLIICREESDEYGKSVTLMNLGIVLEAQGNWSKAIRRYKQSLKIRRHQQPRDRYGECLVLNNLGGVYAKQREWTEAGKCCEESLRICREFGDRDAEGRILDTLGDVFRLQRKWKTAIERYEESLKLRRDVENPRGECLTLVNLCYLYFAKGDVDSALQCAEVARVIGHEIDLQDQLSRLARLDGDVAFERDQISQAAAHYAEACAFAIQFNVTCLKETIESMDIRLQQLVREGRQGDVAIFVDTLEGEWQRYELEKKAPWLKQWWAGRKRSYLAELPPRAS